jgi:GT2 family glycosyltransferase
MSTVPHSDLEGERPDMSIKLHDGSDEMVSIIVVHKDSPAHLNLCLQSIAVTSLNNNYEIIVVDNGSKELEVHDFLEDLESHEVKVVRNKENLWWTKAANQGAKAANKNSKYLIFLHHDVVIINPGWIDMLINVCDTQDSGFVGASMHTWHMDAADGKKTKIDFIEEWCMLISRECWQDCGPFDEELVQVGASFMFTMAAHLQNYKPQVIRNPLVHHYSIFAMDVSDFERYTEQAKVTIPKLMKEQQSKMSSRR